jgi:ATP-binding cassette, subfamily B, bacterial PglK
MNFKTLKILWLSLLGRRKKQIKAILILMITTSLLEVVSIGLVLPFLGVLMGPEKIYQHQYMEFLVEILQITSPDQLLLPLTLFFIFIVMVAGVFRILLLYVITRVSYAIGGDLSIDIFRRTLYQEYKVHIARNSSEIIDGIVSKTNAVVTGVISPVLILISSIILTIIIITALFLIDPIVALVSLLTLGSSYFLVALYTRRQIQENGIIIADNSIQALKFLQEGLGGIRDILIDNTQHFYCKVYRNADLSVRRAAGANQFLSSSPRFLIEAISITLIAGLAYSMSISENGVANAIPTLGALALGAQKLLPALQRAYGSFSRIKGSQATLLHVIALLNQPIPKYIQENKKYKPKSSIPFKREIQLKNLSFDYEGGGDSKVLDEINLIINKGMRIGFIGKTGCGKSTLIDIIMGLLMPKSGDLLIDGQKITKENLKSWQSHISHVPQNIYLSDNTIEANIAFGIPLDQIDHNRVQKAAKQAQIYELIKGWPDKYKTFVGERGVRLSGGQRQRIGIARALYKNANVLIFDEATSALDIETEKLVMEVVNELKNELTIIIVAHRLTTLKDCDKIFELKGGSLATKVKKTDLI